MNVPSAIAVAFLIVAGAVPTLAQRVDDPRAQKVLAQARAALGGEDTLRRVQGLSLVGTFRRSVGDRQLTGEIQLEFQFPDKYLSTESTQMGGATIVRLDGFNAEVSLRDVKTIGGGANMIFRNGPVTGTTPLKGPHGDFARYAMAFVLTPAPMTPLSITYAGEAESPDGKADVLDITGPEELAFKLFIDKSTSRPLMISYQATAPRLVTMTVDGPTSKEDIDKKLKDAHELAQSEPQQPPQDIQLFLSDFSKVDGIMLPHTISRSVNGEPSEEWTIKKLTVNPTFPRDTFTKAKL